MGLVVCICACFVLLTPIYGQAGSVALDKERLPTDITAQNLQSQTKKGRTRAQPGHGQKYYRDWGITKDYTKAMFWYKKAAEQGSAEARYHIGELYYKGRGVKKNYREAFKWFHKAALQNYAGAEFSLGLMYENGNGVARDYVLSYMWFNLSGAGGYRPARAQLDKLEAKITSGQLKEAQKRSMEFTAR